MVDHYGKQLFEGAFTNYVIAEHEQKLKRRGGKLLEAAMDAAIKDNMASFNAAMAEQEQRVKKRADELLRQRKGRGEKETSKGTETGKAEMETGDDENKLKFAAINAAMTDAMASLKPSKIGNAVENNEEKEG